MKRKTALTLIYFSYYCSDNPTKYMFGGELHIGCRIPERSQHPTAENGLLKQIFLVGELYINIFINPWDILKKDNLQFFSAFWLLILLFHDNDDTDSWVTSLCGI